MSNPKMNFIFISAVKRSKLRLEPNEIFNEILVKTGNWYLWCSTDYYYFHYCASIFDQPFANYLLGSKVVSISLVYFRHLFACMDICHFLQLTINSLQLISTICSILKFVTYFCLWHLCCGTTMKYITFQRQQASGWIHTTTDTCNLCDLIL